MKNKTAKEDDWNVCDNSFGYLVYLLNKNGKFSELHLPSLNKIKIVNGKVIMTKKIPRQFSKRVSDICKVIEFSENTNLKVIEQSSDKSFIIIKTSSVFGEAIFPENTPLSEKNKIVNLFFKYHSDINNCGIEISANYETFFNSKKFKKDISDLRNRISGLNQTSFDKKVLAYIDTISELNIAPDFNKLVVKNLHGDFISKNIIKREGNYSLIDLDMIHRGYLEIQYIILLKDLFGFATSDFFDSLKKGKSILSDVSGSELFDFYLLHKIRDLSVIKSAYFTNQKKYNELTEYISSQIDYMMNLIDNRGQFSKTFEAEF